MPKRLLLFGFEKFDKLKTNPSGEVVKLIQKQLTQKAEVHTEILPVTWNEKKIMKIIEEVKPHFIMGFGVSPYPRIQLERIALNYFDSVKPDNKKKIIRHKKIIQTAPLALETNFPIEKMYHYLKEQGLPCVISYHAATYICNYAYYLCLHQLFLKKTNAKIIFIHIPLSPKEVNEMEINVPSFPVEMIAEKIAHYLEKIK